MKRKLFIKSMLLGTSSAICFPFSVLSTEAKLDSFKLKMLYNNIGSDPEFETDWGLSVWAENEKGATLFDTGGDENVLKRNINRAGVELQKLKHIVISHKHEDHSGGLGYILEKTNYKPKVYIVESDFEAFKQKFPSAEIVPVSELKRLGSGVWVTGQLEKYYGDQGIFEQSLLLERDNSLFLITGCSHTGIVEMVKDVKLKFPQKRIELVIGGFHLLKTPDNQIIEISKQLQALQIGKLAASHCTGDFAIAHFKSEWKSEFVDFNLGDSIVV